MRNLTLAGVGEAERRLYEDASQIELEHEVGKEVAEAEGNERGRARGGARKLTANFAFETLC